jgi:dUTP pyrophosphatase
MARSPKAPAVAKPARDDISDLIGGPVLSVKKLRDTAKLPTYATPGSGCFDFYSADPFTRIPAGRAIAINTGLAVEVPEGKVMLIFSRSGHGFNNNVRLANSVGIIDSDYRGEIKVKLRADGANHFDVDEGHRIAQGLLVDAPQWQFSEVAELSETARGADGLGSTGK